MVPKIRTWDKLLLIIFVSLLILCSIFIIKDIVNGYQYRASAKIVKNKTCRHLKASETKYATPIQNDIKLLLNEMKNTPRESERYVYLNNRWIEQSRELHITHLYWACKT